jgi:hypothetical protein
MSFILKRINKEKVKKVKSLKEEDTRPIKGYDLFPELYSNIFCVAKKKSGKTSCIYKIIKDCCTSQTTVIAFCSTLYKDDTWKSIVKMCKAKRIPFIGHSSLYEDGVDQLELLVNLLQNQAREEAEEEELEERVSKLEKAINPIMMNSDSDDEDEKKKRKSKYRCPEYVIVLDDLSNELKSKSLVSLCKKNRHFKCKVVISSQWLNDCLPEVRKQCDYFLVFKGQSKKKLEEIHRDCDVGLELEEFQDIYHEATKKDFSFLYIDTKANQFRRNFDKVFQFG